MTTQQNTANKNHKTTFDIIGDVHGSHGKLVNLFDSLGYQHNDEHYFKEGHQAIFVGDLIDKGDQPAEVLKLVRAMVDSGNAMMVIGNHELNWIHEAADYSHLPEDFIHATNTHYDRYVISEVFEDNTAELIDLFNWLRCQPLYIDLPELRVVHACWNQEAIDLLSAAGINSMNDEALAAYRERYSDLYLAIDLIVAGCTHKFLENIEPNQEFRSIRSRTRWFPLGNVYVNPIELQPILADLLPYPDDAVPVFFGHYALDGEPDILSNNVVGVDFSAVYGGPLVAYRLRPDEVISQQNIIRSWCF